MPVTKVALRIRSSRITGRISLVLLLMTLVLLLMTLVAGCTFWRNFSTYFNTLYLAEKHLEAYEDIINEPQVSTNGSVALQKHRWLDEEYESRELGAEQGNPLPITPAFSQALSSSGQVSNIHLDSAIILGSKILAKDAKSKYVEDALFIVGKAQYYKNDFTGARRKFMELLTRYPNTHYGPTVRVLLSRSMLAMHKLDTAKSIIALAEAQAEKSGDKASLSQVHHAWAEYYFTMNPDSLSRIASELRLAEDGLDDDALADLATQEGILDYFNNDFPAAEAAFRRAANAADNDWLLGEAKINLAIAERKQAKFTAAESTLEDVVGRKSLAASAPAAAYELVRTRDLEARAKVDNNLKSPAFRDSLLPELVAQYHALDTTYRNTSALIIARSSYRTAELYRQTGDIDTAAKYATKLINTRDFSTPQMNELVSTRMRSLAEFSSWGNELVRIDSIKELLKNHNITHNEEAQIRLEALQKVLGPAWRPDRVAQLSKPDSMRLEVMIARIKQDRASTPKLVVNDTARFLDSLTYRASNAHFEIGKDYEAFDEIPHARSEYQTALTYTYIHSDTGKQALRARVLYAWLQLEAHQHNQPRVDSILNILATSYGQTMYAEQARRQFGMHQSGSRGESAYNAAYNTLQKSGIAVAKSQFLDVALSYAKEDVAPRALYALGLTYEDQKSYDSALTYYRRVLREYPYSSYAAELNKRMPGLAEADTRPQPAFINSNHRPGANPAINNAAPPTIADPHAAEKKQMEELEKARKERQELLKKQEQQTLPGQRPPDSTSQVVQQGGINIIPPNPKPTSH